MEDVAKAKEEGRQTMKTKRKTKMKLQEMCREERIDRKGARWRRALRYLTYVGVAQLRDSRIVATVAFTGKDSARLSSSSSSSNSRGQAIAPPWVDQLHTHMVSQATPYQRSRAVVHPNSSTRYLTFPPLTRNMYLAVYFGLKLGLILSKGFLGPLIVSSDSAAPKREPGIRLVFQFIPKRTAVESASSWLLAVTSGG
ncbi:hypothetical protein PT974_01407 [Cladobotryum mycophilum]|uniref:Uncharacterized protein n=1 Tax=Cladobotryum mycophilum TaxID=491253 RepID=A0ABR0T4Q9_9HYPO